MDERSAIQYIKEDLHIETITAKHVSLCDGNHIEEMRHLYGEKRSLQCILIKNLIVCRIKSTHSSKSSVEIKDLLPPLT